MFSWKPICHELAEALMPYRDRQGELIALMKAMQKQGIPVISLTDTYPDGSEKELTVMDPFTFFANFNRGIADKNRLKILDFLRKHFSLSSPLPKDFHGVPLAILLKSWCFPYAKDRDEGDVPALWDIAAACLKQGPDALDPSLFERCLKIKQVALPKLTMGLFWLNPEQYLPLDSLTAEYLKVKEIPADPKKIKNLSQYIAAMNNVRTILGSDFAQISRDAYTEAKKLPLTPEKIDAGFMALLEAMANRNHVTVEQVVAFLSQQPEGGNSQNEVTNRLEVMPKIREILLKRPVDIKGLQKVSLNLWVLKNGQDSMRRNAFLTSAEAAPAITALVDESLGTDEMERIDEFIATAMQNGYADPKGKDSSGAAQFASVLMSAAYPDQYVDYRESRWNKLCELIAGDKTRLCSGGSHSWKMTKAANFAAALANTPTFQNLFGSDHGLWKAGGLAWWFRDGLFDTGQPPATKRYWAGGFTKGEEGSHLEEFKKGNFWQHWYSQDRSDRFAKEVRDLFDQIKPRDEFAIKGYGGKHDLRIHYIGEVTKVVSEEGKVLLKKLDRKLYSGKAPSGAGAGNWQSTLLEVTRDDIRNLIFDLVEPLPPPPPPLKNCPDLNRILYGPPGTGKTFQATHRAVEIVDGRLPDGGDEAVQKRFRELTDSGQIEVVTFHQSFGYEEFVEGIRPSLGESPEGNRPQFTYRDGIFKRLSHRALYAALKSAPEQQKSPKGTGADDTKLKASNVEALHDGNAIAERIKTAAETPRYVLIIDEINRGNVSRILGELITLLEPDKRLGADHQMIVTLPYTGERFGVPPNLFVIGTMNTADKSIALVDVALRRRFIFEECMPDFGPDVCPGLSDIMRKVLREINLRIVLRKDREHQIGHSYFIGSADEESFNNVFSRNILPLLQEYFYNDWDGLRFVLGEGKEEGGRFVRPLDKREDNRVRNQWEWNPAVWADGFGFLSALMSNYKIGGEPQGNA